MCTKIDYDIIYRTQKDYFGTKPHDILKQNYSLIDKNLPVLDIGAGQGRNTLFLSKKGFKVAAIDKSKVSIDIIREKVENEHLSVYPLNSDFESFNPENCKYSAILLFGIIQELTWQSITDLIEKIDKWTLPGSLLFITAHTIEDPEYKTAIEKYKKIGKNSFIDNYGNIKTYMEKDEISKIFCKFAKVYYWEGIGNLHSHDGVNTHQHGSVIAILQKNIQI